MPRGTEYSPFIATAICENIAAGDSLRTVCGHLDLEPRTVWRWLAKFPEFSQQYARAKETGLERLADELVEIADTISEDPNSRKVRIDTRKWIMSKLAPKKYGDRQVIASDSEQPFSVVIRRTVEPK